jgi:dihydrofolate reductase
MTNFTLIAAVDSKMGIGRDNKLPWQIPEDMKHFKDTTTGKPVLMGRKTFESIGRPLPNRHNMVLTRDKRWFGHAGITHLLSVEAAIGYLRHTEEVFVIGGAEIYSQFMPHAQKLILTEINYEFNCDAFFPSFDLTEWQEKSRQTHELTHYPFSYSFVEYERR